MVKQITKGSQPSIIVWANSSHSSREQEAIIEAFYKEVDLTTEAIEGRSQMGFFSKSSGNKDNSNIIGKSIDVDNPLCSKCHKKLPETPSMFGRGQKVALGGSVQQAKSDSTHYAGSVCIKCRAVFCAQCLGQHLDRCPQCGGIAKTAYRGTLKEIA